MKIGLPQSYVILFSEDDCFKNLFMKVIPLFRPGARSLGNSGGGGSPYQTNVAPSYNENPVTTSTLTPSLTGYETETSDVKSGIYAKVSQPPPGPHNAISPYAGVENSFSTKINPYPPFVPKTHVGGHAVTVKPVTTSQYTTPFTSPTNDGEFKALRFPILVPASSQLNYVKPPQTSVLTRPSAKTYVSVGNAPSNARPVYQFPIPPPPAYGSPILPPQPMSFFPTPGGCCGGRWFGPSGGLCQPISYQQCQPPQQQSCCLRPCCNPCVGGGSSNCGCQCSNPCNNPCSQSWCRKRLKR